MKNGLIRRKRIVYIFGIVLPDDKKRRRGRYQKKTGFWVRQIFKEREKPRGAFKFAKYGARDLSIL